MKNGTTFFGVKVDALTRVQAQARLDEKQLIFTPNPEILLEASRNPGYRKALQKGTLMLPDGNGLQLVSTLMFLPRWLRVLAFPNALVLYLFRRRYFRWVFPEIIHGADFMVDVIEKAVEKNWSIFFLGAAPGVAEKTAAYFQKRWPSLKVAGASSENPGKQAFEEVLKAKPQILFVAYGAPKQELWLSEYFEKLPSLRIAMGVGGSFDFYAGVVKRAPLLFRKLGLEWLWRLFLNPIQRGKRIWNAVVVFSFKALLARS
ncbi:WecB/TagA/CpsF family glycosyltransferase [Candidatus Peregrinibacteria bacterium]|nr:MAG: WecB/TagA/CpsF family glycosyltransferase [Candidatus Peregrinibacteria bacterium]